MTTPPSSNIQRKASWSHPFPSPPTTLHRRSHLMRERLFGMVDATRYQDGVEKSRQFLIGSSAYNRIKRPPLRRTSPAERMPRGDIETPAHVVKLELKERRKRVGDDVVERLFVDTGEGHPLREYESSQTDEVNIPEETISKCSELETNSIDIIDEYALLSSLSDAPTERPSSYPVLRPNSTPTAPEAQPTSIHLDKERIEKPDFDSDKYFLEQMALLADNICLRCVSILESQYFRAALRINDEDPKAEQDRIRRQTAQARS